MKKLQCKDEIHFPFNRPVSNSNSITAPLNSKIRTLSGFIIPSSKSISEVGYKKILDELRHITKVSADYLLSKKHTDEEIRVVSNLMKRMLHESWFLELEADLIDLIIRKTDNFFYDCDPLHSLELMFDELLDEANKTSTWNWRDIFAVLTLWCVDETLSHAELNQRWQAAIWLSRANQSLSLVHFPENIDIDFRALQNAKTDLASAGGKAKAKKYEPLKNEIRNHLKTKKYPSRRNAALSLKPIIFSLAESLNIPLSESQADITINDWLKDMDWKKQ